MDISNVYVPDHQKWGKYYDDMLKQRLNRVNEESGFSKPIDFLASNKHSSIPAESSQNAVKVKLVSPVKQTNDQVISELRRDTDTDNIKEGISPEAVRSMNGLKKKGKKKTHSRKQNFKSKTSKIKKKKNKANKKKTVKRRIKDIFSL